jgi:excisionase family DNA binding protein
MDENNHELPPNKPLLRVNEVARFLDISKSSVFRMIHSGDLPIRTFGKLIRIRRDDVLSLVNDKLDQKTDG